MVKLELREFAEATRRMVQLSGVKKTRLMLRVRPGSGRKIFILKSTDGRTTLTTRVKHQGELKLVEGVVDDFVCSCTAALSPPPAVSAAATASAPRKQTEEHRHEGSTQQQQQQQQQQQHGNKRRKGGRH